jgi:hypothetical protein
MSENTEDRKYMGTKNEAEAKLIAASRAWRETRQPMMGTRADLNANDVAERELRFCLANAALLWLWHQENPDPVLSPVPISSEKMELAHRIEVGLATEVDGSFSPLNREQWIMIVAALRASSPAQEPAVTTETVAQHNTLTAVREFLVFACDGEDRTNARRAAELIGSIDGLVAIPAPPQPGRDAVIEALKPFADAARAFTSAIGPDGIDDGIAVSVTMHGTPREVIMSTADFSAAAHAIKEDQK